jgi:hypothetical protein
MKTQARVIGILPTCATIRALVQSVNHSRASISEKIVTTQTQADLKVRLYDDGERSAPTTMVKGPSLQRW